MAALNRVQKMAFQGGTRDAAKEPWLGGSWEIYEAAARSDAIALGAIWSKLPSHAKAEALLQAAWAWGGTDDSWSAWENAHQDVWPAAGNLATTMLRRAIDIDHAACAGRLAERVQALSQKDA